MSRRGKKILDLPWEKDGITIKVPIRAVTVRDHKNHCDKMEFQAKYPDAGLDISNTDINVLKKAVEDALDQWYSITWDLYFRIDISGGESGQHSLAYDVHYEVEFFVVGKDSRGETRHMRIPKPDKISKDWKNVKPMQWGGEEPKDGWPETHSVEEHLKILEESRYSYGRRNPLTRALVPATPENVAAAEEFKRALSTTLDKMHKHFAPDVVEKTLKNAARLLLPAAEKETR